MTINDSRSPEELHDNSIVENLLTETGMNGSADVGLLRPALLSVRELARGPQPVPGGQLAVLLARAETETRVGPRPGTVTSLQDRRTKHHSRLTIAAAAVCLSLGAGAAAAAASPDIRRAILSTVSTLVETWTFPENADRTDPPVPSGWTPAPSPSAPSTPVPSEPAPSPVVKQDQPEKATLTEEPPPPSPDSVRRPGATLPQPETGTGPEAPPVMGDPAPAAPAPAPPVAPPQPADPGTMPKAPRQPDTISTPSPTPPPPVPAPENETPPRPGQP